MTANVFYEPIDLEKRLGNKTLAVYVGYNSQITTRDNCRKYLQGNKQKKRE